MLNVMEEDLFMPKTKLFIRFMMVTFEKEEIKSENLRKLKQFLHQIYHFIKFGSSGTKDLIKSSLFVKYEIFQKF